MKVRSLRGKHLIQARRVIEKRGPGPDHWTRHAAQRRRRHHLQPGAQLPARGRTAEADGQKAEFAQQRLLFVSKRTAPTLADENFTNLLRAEGLDTLPKYLAERVWPEAARHDRQTGLHPDPDGAARQILPSRKVPEGLRPHASSSRSARRSRHVGLIEPLSWRKADKTPASTCCSMGTCGCCAGQLGFTDAPCLIATDDESYTYNNRINRLSTIQEHFMIRRAVERGVTPERLAKALSVDISHITKKINLLDGICPEAVDCSRIKHFSANWAGTAQDEADAAGRVRRTDGGRQQHDRRLRRGAAGGHDSQHAGQRNPQESSKVSPPIKWRRWSAKWLTWRVSSSWSSSPMGRTCCNLVLARGYLTKLLDNEAVIRFLSQNNPDILREFSGIVQATSLDGNSECAPGMPKADTSSPLLGPSLDEATPDAMSEVAIHRNAPHPIPLASTAWLAKWPARAAMARKPTLCHRGQLHGTYLSCAGWARRVPAHRQHLAPQSNCSACTSGARGVAAKAMRCQLVLRIDQALREMDYRLCTADSPWRPVQPRRPGGPDARRLSARQTGRSRHRGQAAVGGRIRVRQRAASGAARRQHPVGGAARLLGWRRSQARHQVEPALRQ
jgi:hypothetical protein